MSEILALNGLSEQQKTDVINNLGNQRGETLILLFDEGTVDADTAVDVLGDFTNGEIEYISTLAPELAEYLNNAAENSADAVNKQNKANNTNAESSDIGDIDAMNAEIERLDAEIATAKEQLEIKNDELETAKAKLKQDQAELDELKNKQESKQKEYEKIKEEIEKATSDLETSQKEEQQQAIYKAMGEYNEQEDGPWEQYLETKLSKLSGNNPKISSLIENLSGQSQGLATELGSLQNKMTTVQGLVDADTKAVNGLQLDVSNIESTIATNEATKTQLSQKVLEAVLNSISKEEMALVEQNNIDLNAKYPDGSPKYIFAKGKEDGKYHIYEMNECGTAGTSLARTYGCNGGFDIIPSGNGYLNDLNKVEDGNGEKIYYMNDCGSVGSFNGCYTTCSPLSFDLNGDGVKTSDEIIEYDIDGDGILDKINDSADGVLVFDKDGDGVSGADGSECFGDNTDIDGNGKKDGYKDGFEALKTFALEAGVIDGINDNVIDENDIKFLEENYGFKMKAGGYNSEAVSLLDLGITEINLAQTDKTTMNDNFDNMGNQLMTQDGATFKQNGEIKDYADIWHQKKN